MKITVIEHDGCFSLDLCAETMAEMTLLVRLGANARKELQSFLTYAQKGGSIETSIALPKMRSANNVLPRRKR